MLLLWTNALDSYNCLHKNSHFWTVSKCIMGCRGLKDPPIFFRSMKVDTCGCTIHTITQKYVTSCSLIVAGCLNVLGVKQSLCTIFSGTPCSLTDRICICMYILYYDRQNLYLYVYFVCGLTEFVFGSCSQVLGRSTGTGTIGAFTMNHLPQCSNSGSIYIFSITMYVYIFSINNIRHHQQLIQFILQ